MIYLFYTNHWWLNTWRWIRVTEHSYKFYQATAEFGEQFKMIKETTT